jgi:hypothetical protein
MSEELGKIEKPAVESFEKGKKLFFVPVIYYGQGIPEGYKELLEKYWDQVAKQLDELTSKLGMVNKIFHELIDASGEQGASAIKGLNERSYNIIKQFMDQKAEMEALENSDTLTEYMDWNRCLMIGLQNPKVMTKIYDSYVESGKKRNEQIAKKLGESLKDNEIGVLMMRENHQVQFPPDIQVFYVSPPALDEIKRYVREQETRAAKDTPAEEQ